MEYEAGCTRPRSHSSQPSLVTIDIKYDLKNRTEALINLSGDKPLVQFRTRLGLLRGANPRLVTTMDDEPRNKNANEESLQWLTCAWIL